MYKNVTYHQDDIKRPIDNEPMWTALEIPPDSNFNVSDFDIPIFLNGLDLRLSLMSNAKGGSKLKNAFWINYETPYDMDHILWSIWRDPRTHLREISLGQFIMILCQENHAWSNAKK